MASLRMLTAGESHGPGLAVIVEGLPRGLALTPELIDVDLARRQAGYGRGGRMSIEHDRVTLRSGVRHGVCTGSPVTMLIDNRDYANWQTAMQPEPTTNGADVEDIRVHRPRPGHADLAGALKYLTHDARDVVERASARNTATRVAAGAAAKALLAAVGVRVTAHVVALGGIEAKRLPGDFDELARAAESSPVRCADPEASVAMVSRIDEVRRQGDSLGGTIEIIATHVPPGLGHFAEWDRRLDGRLARALMSIPAVKGCEIGDGFASAARRGSEVHDEIVYDAARHRYDRPTNRAGGIEGGMSNGEAIVLRVAMKPIPTLARPLASVDLETHGAVDAGKERTDSVAVPACAVVCEAAVAWELAVALLERFGGETLNEVREHVTRFDERLALL